MAKILITGGSGFVGKAISELLLKQGHEPVWLSRQAGEWHGIKIYKWDIGKSFIDDRAFEGVDRLIHLAGAGIADKRWTSRYKQEIVDSRVKSSALLFQTVAKGGYRIQSLVGASAIGYYGARQSEHVFSENDFPGTDFLASTCRLWEKSYSPFINSGIRTTVIRTGIVLGKNGGYYKKMLPIFRMGAGFALGSGKQYFPWIHLKDIAALYLQALMDDRMSGPYNAVGSELVTNQQASEQLAKSLNRPFFLPRVPSFALQLGLGESAAMLTEGLKISNAKAKDAGFAFHFETLGGALADLRTQ